ncbi:hypothetical protein ALP29_201063 [Pseudomonas syringae pv. avii]|uniref:Uncharacterized protein n=2 Tax=Pseudomonas syringae group TaxID=136849 RepID=A0A3M5VET0_PSESX|nr:hypothetical protein ALP29_201063 [Pseudomonas syringae pv. avii]
MQVYLRLQQRFAQRRQSGLVGVIVNGMTDFSGFKHAQLLMSDGSMTPDEECDHRLPASVNPRSLDSTFICADG